MKIKIICNNCNTKQSTKYIRAMLKAGFGLGHLACCECGQHTLVNTAESES